MPTPDDEPSAAAPISRDELVAMVARAHHASAYGESSLAGQTLAAQSKLPRLVAVNLGAGFGQWDFFPEAADIVEFAHAYEPPDSEETLWALAKRWASDDAAGRHTVLALVGREILQHELRRIEVPALRELVDEPSPGRARELRTALGLEVGAAPPPGAAPKRKAAGGGKRAPARTPGAIPTRMPKPAFVRPPPKGPAPPAKRFGHPKFGEGVLERQEGEGPDAKLTIKFAVGSKTLLARFVTEVEDGA